MSIVDLMDDDLALGERYIREMEYRAPDLYHRFKVGGREILSPDPELKLLQCWVGDFIRAESPGLPSFVSAYESGRSVRGNALMHAAQGHLLALDIHSFFRSCSKELVRGMFASMRVGKGGLPLTQEDIRLLVALTCYKGALVMGSPSSPFIANRIMLPVDSRIIASLSPGYAYSRYSDDICISSDERIDEDAVVSEVGRILADYGFVLNPGKTRCCGRGGARRVTGVFITPDGQLSIGSKRKRELRASLYGVLMGKQCAEETAMSARSVLGMINFCREIEPGYLNGLLAKYSSYGLAAKAGGVIPALSMLIDGEGSEFRSSVMSVEASQRDGVVSR